MDRDEFLNHLRTCRDACVRAHTKAPINSDVYRQTDKLMEAIDDMAGVLTGDRTHFHLKMHTAGPPADES